jgi:hypothetical protein
MKSLVLALVSLVLAGAATAQNRTIEIWQATWDGARCTLVLTYDLARLQGNVETRRPCGRTLGKVASFVYTDERRDHMILFARPGARGDILGSFEATGQGRMEGVIGDGLVTVLVMTERSSTTLGTGTTQGNADCIRYADGGCARPADLKNPDIPFGSPAPMRALGRLDIYPFSGGKGFKKDETVTPGQCRSVKKCETAFGTDEDWCEVILSDGFFTGWVRRQDANFVYLRKGC